MAISIKKLRLFIIFFFCLRLIPSVSTTANMSDYTEAHKVLLTYIRSCRYVEQSELLGNFVLICNAYNIQSPLNELLDNYIGTINSRISHQMFKIDRKKHEVTGDLYYIFINTTPNESIKQSTTYSPVELDAIKGLIDSIIEAPDFKYSIGKSNAQRSIASTLNRSLAETSAFITELVDEGWFTITLQERLLLSIKSLCELKTYLIDRYGIYSTESDGKILICAQCKELVTLGFISVSDNPLSFHRTCYDVYCRNNNVDPDESSLCQVGPDPTTI